MTVFVEKHNTFVTNLTFHFSGVIELKSGIVNVISKAYWTVAVVCKK